MPIFAAIATALPAIISAGGGIANSVISGNNSSSAARKALEAQQAASSEARNVSASGLGSITDALNHALGTASAGYAPYMQAGNAALSQQMALLGLGAPPQAAGPVAGPSGAQAFTAPQQLGAPNWAAYVQNNPDVLQAYNTTGKSQGTSLEDFGKWHWNTFGQHEAAAGDPNRTFTPYGPAQQQGDAAAQQQAASGAAGTAQIASTSAAPAVDPAVAQQQAIDGIKNGPLFASLLHTGSDNILANGAATGGLRGGNTQNALGRYGGDLLGQLIQQHLQNLSGLSNNGQSAVGNLGSINNSLASIFANSTNGTSSNISNLITGNGNNTASAGIIGAGINNAAGSNMLTGLSSLGGSGPIQQLLSALGLGGGIQTSPLSSLTSFPSVAANAAPTALSTTLPSLAF